MKDNKRHLQTLYEIGDKLLVIDGVKRFKENEENDPSQLDDKSELIKFAVKNLYE